MIIEHEAAGTLLKSTENRAGGFTCRINFYLVSCLPLLLSLRPSPTNPPVMQTLFTLHYTERDRFSCLPIAFSPDRRTEILQPFRIASKGPCFFLSTSTKMKLLADRSDDFSRTILIFLTDAFICHRRRAGEIIDSFVDDQTSRRTLSAAADQGERRVSIRISF